MELNEQVAVALGWTRCTNERAAWVWILPGETCLGLPHQYNLPDYEHDIAAAWKLVEWADKNLKREEKMAFVGFLQDLTWEKNTNAALWMLLFYVTPEAICRAFLAVQEQDNES